MVAPSSQKKFATANLFGKEPSREPLSASSWRVEPESNPMAWRGSSDLRWAVRKKVIIAWASPGWWPRQSWSLAAGLIVQLNSIVQCQSGHLFTTIWIPGASFKSLGWAGGGCNVARWSPLEPGHTSSGIRVTEEEKASAALALTCVFPEGDSISGVSPIPAPAQ